MRNNNVFLRITAGILSVCVIFLTAFLMVKSNVFNTQNIVTSDEVQTGSNTAEGNNKIASGDSKGKTEKTDEKPQVTKPEREIIVKNGKSYIDSSESFAYDAKNVRRWMRNKDAEDYPKEKLVFLTFDDGPSGNVTPKILDTLKKNDVHATFFTLAKDPEGKKNNLIREYKEGHAVALHSYSHDYGYLYPNGSANADNILADTEKGLANLKKALGEEFNPTVFRYPGGHMSWDNMEVGDKVIKEKGMNWIDWNTMTGDADNRNDDHSPSGLVRFMAKVNERYDVSGVVVVLMHDSEVKENTAEALQGVIDYYKERGYKFGILK